MTWVRLWSKPTMFKEPNYNFLIYFFDNWFDSETVLPLEILTWSTTLQEEISGDDVQKIMTGNSLAWISEMSHLKRFSVLQIISTNEGPYSIKLSRKQVEFLLRWGWECNDISHEFIPDCNLYFPHFVKISHFQVHKPLKFQTPTSRICSS